MYARKSVSVELRYFVKDSFGGGRRMLEEEGILREGFANR